VNPLKICCLCESRRASQSVYEPSVSLRWYPSVLAGTAAVLARHYAAAEIVVVVRSDSESPNDYRSWQQRE